MSSSKPYDHRARDLTNADIIFTEKAILKQKWHFDLLLQVHRWYWH